MTAGRKPIPRPGKEDFLKMLNETKSPRALGEQLGYSHVTIHEWMKAYEIKRVITYE